MRPIPKKMLIHSATIEAVASKDRWGKETFSSAVDLKNVRFEPSTKIVKDKQNNDVQLACTLFYDCKNSLPKNVNFYNDQIISFNSEKYKVQIIEPLYDMKKLHHYELGLIKHG